MRGLHLAGTRTSLLVVALWLAAAVTSTAQPPPARHGDVPAIATALLREGRADSALVVVRRALRTDSTDAGLWLALGDVYRALGRTTAGIAAFRRARLLQPASAQASTGLAEGFLVAGMVDSARVYAWETIKLGQWRNPNLYYLIGRVYEAEGKADSAIIYYRWALSFLPRPELF